MKKDRRDFVKNISVGALSLSLPNWSAATDRGAHGAGANDPEVKSAEAKNVEVKGPGEKNSGETFADRWEYIGIAVSEPGYHVWGTSPVMDEKGRVHLFAARWPAQYKVDPGWRSHSEIAHYVGDSPEGPFRFSDVAIRGTGRDTWDKYGAHNPTVHRVGEQYVLLYIANTDYRRPPHPANQCIGMAVAETPYGPWKKINGDGLILQPPTNRGYWNHKARNGVVNPAFLQYKGGFLLYFKSQDSKMGLAVSENLGGPYQQLPFSVTRNESTIEDGYAFLYDNKICLLTTDNHGILKRGGGILWRSDDGVLFQEKEPGFKLINEYVDSSLIKNPRWHYGPNDSMKFERPQLLMIDNKPAYLYVPSGCNIFGGASTVSYVLKSK